MINFDQRQATFGALMGSSPTVGRSPAEEAQMLANNDMNALGGLPPTSPLRLMKPEQQRAFVLALRAGGQDPQRILMGLQR